MGEQQSSPNGIAGGLLSQRPPLSLISLISAISCPDILQKIYHHPYAQEDQPILLKVQTDP